MGGGGEGKSRRACFKLGRMGDKEMGRGGGNDVTRDGWEDDEKGTGGEKNVRWGG